MGLPPLSRRLTVRSPASKATNASKPRATSFPSTSHSRLSRTSRASTSIHVAAVRNPRDEDDALRVVNRVDDAVVAHTHAVVIPAGELDRTGRPGLSANPSIAAVIRSEVVREACGTRALPQGQTYLVLRSTARQLLPNVSPRDGELTLVARLERGEAVLEDTRRGRAAPRSGRRRRARRRAGLASRRRAPRRIAKRVELASRARARRSSAVTIRGMAKLYS